MFADPDVKALIALTGGFPGYVGHRRRDSSSEHHPPDSWPWLR